MQNLSTVNFHSPVWRYRAEQYRVLKVVAAAEVVVVATGGTATIRDQRPVHSLTLSCPARSLASSSRRSLCGKLTPPPMLQADTSAYAAS